MAKAPWTHWTGAQIVLLKRNYGEKGAAWVADQTGHSKRAVWAKASEIGLAKRLSPNKVAATAEERAAIERAYRSTDRSAVVRCAKSLGRSLTWVRYRAGEWGLNRRGRSFTRWTEEETDFAVAHAHLTRAQISRMMRAKGRTRSSSAIEARLRQIGHTRDDNSRLQPPAVAALLGVTSTTVIKWIRTGLLRAELMEDRSGQEKDFHSIGYEDIARMIVQHPTLINLAKVDPVWFIDLMAHHGALGLIDTRDKSSRIVKLKLEKPSRSNSEIAALVESTKESGAVQISKARKEGLLPPVDPTSIQSLRAA